MNYNQNDPVFEIDNTSKRARNSANSAPKTNVNSRNVNNAGSVSRNRAVVTKKNEKSGSLRFSYNAGNI